jgi:putative ABC transport system permease protein
MIGLGLVVFVAVFAHGLKSSFLDAFERSVKADVVTMYTGGAGNVPVAAAEAMVDAPGVASVSGVVFGQVKTSDGQTTFFNAIGPDTWPSVWQLDWRGGADNNLLDELGRDGVVVDDLTAKRRGWQVGDTFRMTSAAGRTAKVTVLGLYRDPFLMSGVTMDQELCEQLEIPVEPSIAMATGVPGADDEDVKAAVEHALAGFPTQSVYTQQGYEDLVNGQINQLLMMLYALLAMSVTISAFGIVNTLVLSVYERTREIGMLRAIGTSRRQMRRIVRYESVITSVIGGLMGTAVGVAFAYAVTTRYADQGFTFSVPAGQLGVFLVVAVVVGVMAAVLPARRAARVDILEAIHHE